MTLAGSVIDCRMVGRVLVRYMSENLHAPSHVIWSFIYVVKLQGTWFLTMDVMYWPPLAGRLALSRLFAFAVSLIRTLLSACTTFRYEYISVRLMSRQHGIHIGDSVSAGNSPTSRCHMVHDVHNATTTTFLQFHKRIERCTLYLTDS